MIISIALIALHFIVVIPSVQSFFLPSEQRYGAVISEGSRRRIAKSIRAVKGSITASSATTKKTKTATKTSSVSSSSSSSTTTAQLKTKSSDRSKNKLSRKLALLPTAEDDPVVRSLSPPTTNFVAQSYYEFDWDFNQYGNGVEENEIGDDTRFNIASSEQTLLRGRVLSKFQQLQRSVEKEILPSDLQTMIDQGASSIFDHWSMDATEMEKVAMRTITEQLPQAAVKALQKQQDEAPITHRRNSRMRQEQKTEMPSRSLPRSPEKLTKAVASESDKYTNNLNFAKGKRVTHEREIELARIIQQGAALYKIRTDALQQGIELSRQEWADLVGITPKELRRRVSDYRRAKHDLVTANIGLVHTVVNQLWPVMYAKTGISKEEMVQEGSLGLLRAAELFDPERGLRFSTYAVVWIKGTLSNSHLPELVKLPQREKTKWNKILQAQKQILALNNVPHDNGGEGATNAASMLRVPIEQLSAATGFSVSDILSTHRRMRQSQRVFSLDFEYQTQHRSGSDDAASSSVASRIKDDNDLMERMQLHADILAAMARNLDEREARLVRLRYGLSDGRARSLQECADAMGLSYTRVYQLSQRCLDKLRQAAEAESLEEYLLTIA